MNDLGTTIKWSEETIKNLMNMEEYQVVWKDLTKKSLVGSIEHA